jgi:hypothetical protein
LIRAENPDDTEVESASHNMQQEIFEQFNAQIEQSFSEQQQHLDEIFKQTAKQFFEQRQPNSLLKPQPRKQDGKPQS